MKSLFVIDRDIKSCCVHCGRDTSTCLKIGEMEVPVCHPSLILLEARIGNYFDGRDREQRASAV